MHIFVLAGKFNFFENSGFLTNFTCNNVANCSGLYSVLGIFDGLGCSLVTADMLGNRTEAGGGPGGRWPPNVGIPVGRVGPPGPQPPLDRTSTMLCMLGAGMGWDTGSSPIRILFAFSDSFSHALASNCSAWILVRWGGAGRA